MARSFIRYGYVLALLLSLCVPSSTKPSGILPLFYNNTFGSTMRSCITTPWLSSLAGWYADSRLSSYHIKGFVKEHGINMDEAQQPDIARYPTFNDFFTRKLKPTARPIDRNPETIISPADGQLFAIEDIGPDTEVLVKGKSFDLATFLGDENLADQLIGGTLIIIYLAPHDYHRFHFPVNATPRTAKRIKGNYESVHPLVYNNGIQPLTENERQITLLKTQHCSNVPFISVGALCVGRIINTFTPEQAYKKGHEMGYFSFGGSTVAMVFPKQSLRLDPSIKTQLQQKNTVPVKMGQRIGSIAQ